MRLLFLGDIVGRPGYHGVVSHLPEIRKTHRLDFVAVNAENAADGSGLTQRQFKGLVDAGVNAITMGDHIYKKMEIRELLDRDPRIVKPANFPTASPGRPWTVIKSVPLRPSEPPIEGRRDFAPGASLHASGRLSIYHHGSRANRDS